MKPPSEKKTS